SHVYNYIFYSSYPVITQANHIMNSTQDVKSVTGHHHCRHHHQTDIIM
ncbi:hypothetical protein X975_14400, partial [Stegodyphus mimosarum]